MSDQPKPATGEWTAESVYGIIRQYELGDAYSAIADAHNAAIAAEREVGHNTAVALGQQIIKLEDQLTAEREALATVRELRDLDQKQLAAAVEALKEFENEYPHITRMLAEIRAK